MRITGVRISLLSLVVVLATGCAMGFQGLTQEEAARLKVCNGTWVIEMSPEERARIHWTAITKNDLAATTRDYSGHSVLDWVGGPLNGKYTGPEAIRGVWGKFFEGQGPLTVDISNVQVKEQDSTQTVTARTIFKGKVTIPVDYTLVYQGRCLAAETWKIRP